MCMAVSSDWLKTYIGDGPMIESCITWFIAQIVQMVSAGIVLVNDPFQRSWKWSKDKASLFIHSLIFGFPVMMFWANATEIMTKTKSGKNQPLEIYSIMDGKQRLMTCFNYLNDGFALSNVPPIWVSDELLDINGKKFSELPKAIQDKIANYKVEVHYFKNMTISQKRELFRRLNNGQPLTAKEKNIANCMDLETLTEIGNHSFFQKTLTDKAKEQRNQITLVMKAYMMLHLDMGDFDFSSKDMAEAMESVNVADEEKAELIAILDRYEQIYDALEGQKKSLQKRLGTETHFVSLVPFIKRSLDEDISVKRMVGFIKNIFEDKVIISDVYTDACKSGSNHTQSIMTRNEEIEKEWDFYFNTGDTEEEETADEDSTDTATATAEENTVAEEETSAEEAEEEVKTETEEIPFSVTA